MIETLLTSLIKDLLKLLSQKRDFFELEIVGRRAVMIHLPLSVQKYLQETEPESFVLDLEQSLKCLREGHFYHHDQRQNGLLIALGHFIAEEVVPFLDSPAEHNSQSELYLSLSEVNRAASYEEVADQIQNFLRDILDNPFILIQTAAPISADFRRDIRNHFRKKHPFASPVFQVNSSLLGGLRVFLNGEVYDHTWLNRIERIYQLN